MEKCLLRELQSSDIGVNWPNETWDGHTMRSSFEWNSAHESLWRVSGDTMVGGPLAMASAWMYDGRGPPAMASEWGYDGKGTARYGE